MHLLIAIFLVLSPILVFSTELSESRSASCPAILLYQDKPIPNIILDEFFGLAVIGFGQLEKMLDIPDSIQQYAKKPSDLKVTYEWKYLGSLYKDVHAVWAYYWEEGCMGKFTGILILKREGDVLHIVDVICGGDRHSSMIFNQSCHIHENMIVYSQGATTASIVDIALDENPELKEVYAKSSKQGIFYGEAGFFGTIEMVAKIDSCGKIQEIVRTGFTPVEGSDRKVEEIYQKDGYKGLALLLIMDDNQG